MVRTSHFSTHLNFMLVFVYETQRLRFLEETKSTNLNTIEMKLDLEQYEISSNKN